MIVLDEGQGSTELSWRHPLGSMNVCVKCKGNTKKVISVWAKMLDSKSIEGFSDDQLF